MIAFFGAGLMGAGFVQALRSRGEDVRVWNRTPERARALEVTGAVAVADAAECARGADRLHFSLSADAAVDALLARLEGAIDAGAIIVDHSTVSPAGTARRAATLAAKGVAFLSAPVFMNPTQAREGKGLMLVAGPAALHERARPFLEQMTGAVWYVGDRVERAAAYKLMGNATIVASVSGLADALAIARANGLTPAEGVELFAHFNPASQLAVRGPKMARQDWTPTFELAMARKDVGLMLDAVGDAAPLALLPAIAERMDALLERGHGKHDLAVLAVDSVKP